MKPTRPMSELRASRSRPRAWAYVEVPVMIRGTFNGGKAFSSAGSVTVRKATSGPEAGRGWRIYTGER